MPQKKLPKYKKKKIQKREEGKKKKRNCHASLGGLEPPTFRLTAERANRLRHRDKLFDRRSSNRTQSCQAVSVYPYKDISFLGNFHTAFDLIRWRGVM